MDEIIKKYATDVKRFCMSLCHDAYLAEELTQETFDRALKTIDRYNGECLMTTWLFRIAKRAWMIYERKRRMKLFLNRHQRSRSFWATPSKNVRSILRRNHW